MGKKIWSEELLFQKFMNLTNQGVKLTKENLDKVDTNIYKKAEELFQGWKNAKKSFYAYAEYQKNSENKIKKTLISKIEEVEKVNNMSLFKKGNLNKEFVDYVEKNDKFIASLIIDVFQSWDNLSVEYSKFLDSEYSEREIAKMFVEALSKESILNENEFAKKYCDLYNIICRKYGSMKDAVVVFMNKQMAANA